MPNPITSLGVVGGGFMGVGIAESAARYGIAVVVSELPQYLDEARRRLETSLDRAVKRGKLDAAERDSAVARVTFTSELTDLAGAEMVIEAVPEDVELKSSIVEALGAVVGDQVYEEFKRDEYAPPPLMKRMIAAGRLGRKSGRGFYEYAAAG